MDILKLLLESELKPSDPIIYNENLLVYRTTFIKQINLAIDKPILSIQAKTIRERREGEFVVDGIAKIEIPTRTLRYTDESVYQTYYSAKIVIDVSDESQAEKKVKRAIYITTHEIETIEEMYKASGNLFWKIVDCLDFLNNWGFRNLTEHADIPRYSLSDDSGTRRVEFWYNILYCKSFFWYKGQTLEIEESTKPEDILIFMLICDEK